MTLITATTYLEDLNLNPKIFNPLRRSGIHTINDLIQMTKDQLIALPQLGPKTVDELEQIIRPAGFALKRSNGYVKRQNEYEVLQQIHGELKSILAREEKRHEMDQHLVVGASDAIEEAIALLEEVMDGGDPGDVTGEPPITSAEMHSAAWKQHQEMHR